MQAAKIAEPSFPPGCELAPPELPPVELHLAELPSTDLSGHAVGAALAESRQRWRLFGALATDMAFELDRAGRLTFLAPDDVLGRPSSLLLGTEASSLLMEREGPNPFGNPLLQRRRRCWLRAPGGVPACMEVTVQPMLDAAGRPAGWRGVGVDVTEQEARDTEAAAGLRRAEALDHILGQLRQETLAPRMMSAMLEQCMDALGSDGALVVDLSREALLDGPEAGPDPDGAEPGEAGTGVPGTGGHDLLPAGSPVLHASGAALPARALAQVTRHLLGDDEDRSMVLADGAAVLACRCTTRFGLHAALVTWRHAPARAWDDDDRQLSAAVVGVIRIVLEHETIQRELAHQARTDALTGLLNRRAFMEEATRRLDRLDAEGLPGTLLFLDLDHFKQLNDSSGHEAGDAALVACARMLLRTFRPTDLIARLGGDEFAVWLDGADHLTAAERAEDLTRGTPHEMAHLTDGMAPMGMSVGIATRAPGCGETLEEVVGRADMAMYDVKRTGRGRWRVARPLDVL